MSGIERGEGGDAAEAAAAAAAEVEIEEIEETGNEADETGIVAERAGVEVTTGMTTTTATADSNSNNHNTVRDIMTKTAEVRTRTEAPAFMTVRARRTVRRDTV